MLSDWSTIKVVYCRISKSIKSPCTNRIYENPHRKSVLGYKFPTWSFFRGLTLFMRTIQSSSIGVYQNFPEGGTSRYHFTDSFDFQFFKPNHFNSISYSASSSSSICDPSTLNDLFSL